MATHRRMLDKKSAPQSSPAAEHHDSSTAPSLSPAAENHLIAAISSSPQSTNEEIPTIRCRLCYEELSISPWCGRYLRAQLKNGIMKPPPDVLRLQKEAKLAKIFSITYLFYFYRCLFFILYLSRICVRLCPNSVVKESQAYNLRIGPRFYQASCSAGS